MHGLCGHVCGGASENVAREIFVAHDVGEHAVDVGLVDRDVPSGSSGASNDTSSSSFSITVCSRRAPMFSVRSLTIVAKSAIRSIAPGVNESVDALGREQRRVLLDQRVLRLGQDADEILAAERLELDPDREAALQLRNQIRRLRDVERAGRDEQDVIGPHHPVLRVDGRALRRSAGCRAARLRG